MLQVGSNKTIVVGMSGGVDSSVCACLLKKQGYNVIGVFMQNWDTFLNNDFLGHVKTHENECNVKKDFSDVQRVAKIIGIKVYKVDFIKKYWNNVFKHLITEYKRGRTPNPDILCNKFIKFGSFLAYAKKTFKCAKIAMGHYAKVCKIKNKYYLKTCADTTKDQTYFLSYINQKQLSNVIFPLSHITKQQVREIAKKENLPNWNKKDSTGICFIGERKFKDFLTNYIKQKQGKIIDITTKKQIGTHDGVSYFTYGQNSHLGLSGQTKKYYVCKKDVNNNIIYVCDQHNKDKYLSSTHCELIDFNWINRIPKKTNVKIKFRYRQKPVNGSFCIKNNKIVLTYVKTFSVTPGQFAVLYQAKTCLGGGVVNKI